MPIIKRTLTEGRDIHLIAYSKQKGVKRNLAYGFLPINLTALHIDMDAVV